MAVLLFPGPGVPHSYAADSRKTSIEDLLRSTLERGYREQDLERLLSAYEDDAVVVDFILGALNKREFGEHVGRDFRVLAKQEVKLTVLEEEVRGDRAGVKILLEVRGDLAGGMKADRADTYYLLMERGKAGWKIRRQGYRPDFTVDASPHEEKVGGFYIGVSSLAQMRLADVVEDLLSARVIFVGESHPEIKHHQVQQAIIRGLKDRGQEVAVGMEMFLAESRADLDRWTRGEGDVEDMKALFSDNWYEQYWPVYRDLLLFTRHEGIPVFGLNIRREIIRVISRDGFDSLEESTRDTLPRVSCRPNSKYMKLLMDVMGIKDDAGEGINTFCEAQLTWDAVMARSLARYMEEHPGHIIVVLAGNFHAWKHGIPEQLGRLSDVPYRVILPSSDKLYLKYDVMLQDADYVWWEE